MTEQTFIREKILRSLSEKKAKNPQFSLRSMARRLDIAPSTLSEVIQGKRKVSQKLIRQLAQKLEFSPAEMNELKEAVGYSFHVSDQREFIYLNQTAFEVYSDWIHFALISLIETGESDPSQMAYRLGVTDQQVKVALTRLLNLEMIELREDEYFNTGKTYSTPDDVVDLAVRKGHRKNLELAEQSLDSCPLEERDFSAMTLTFNREDMKEAKKMIRKFHDSFENKFRKEDNQDVYKICMQFFPLTKKERSQ